MSRLKRAVHLALAALFFALAVIGVVLPVVPTTPFLLLCSYFLARSSPRLQRRLQRSRVFGPFLRDWHERGGVRKPVKVWAIACVVTVVGVTLWLSTLPLLARSGLVVLAATGIVVILRVPTAATETVEQSPRAVDSDPPGLADAKPIRS